MKLRSEPSARLSVIPSDDIHIASLVIHVRPEHRSDVIAFLNTIPECTVYEEQNQNALVTVLEVSDEQSINSTINALNTRDGILSVNLVYHHCDAAATLNQEITP